GQYVCDGCGSIYIAVQKNTPRTRFTTYSRPQQTNSASPGLQTCCKAIHRSDDPFCSSTIPLLVKYWRIHGWPRQVESGAHLPTLSLAGVRCQVVRRRMQLTPPHHGLRLWPNQYGGLVA
ncbi:unnamed protein product, partial [Ectocarpus sp. 12 AP-2014]